jgi:electron transfer flavoprotein beta subunit
MMTATRPARCWPRFWGGHRAPFVSGIEIKGDSAAVIREVDGGLEHLEIRMPAVVTVDLRLNEPRYASLPNIMKAKKKPLDSISAADLGVDITPRLNITRVEEPPAREAGIKVSDVAELVDKLKNEAKVI